MNIIAAGSLDDSKGAFKMKVHVDPESCQGHLRCIQYAPDVFEVDDLGYASTSAATIPNEREEAVRQAAATCPERAITITE
jgi:ferredoxin